MTDENSRIRWLDNHSGQSVQEPIKNTRTIQPEIENERTETPSLNQYGRDLTKLAQEGKLSPLFGRKKELLKLQRILLRKTKSNPLLVGAAGVGKTALVEGLAIAIVNCQAEEMFHNKRIIEIIPSMLVAGTQYRGTFEEKLQSIVTEAQSSPDLILFIDEIHTLIRAGSVEGGSLDAANILKPALSRGYIRCIGSTTSDEYDKFISSDAAFQRRFEPLMLDEPNESEAIEIITASIPSYENHHQVKILPSAVEAAVRLSTQHVLDRRLPDKAFDLLDSACTYLRVPDQQSTQIEDEQSIVDESIISLVLSEKLNIPVNKLSEDLNEKLEGLEAFLNNKIYGQPLALARVSSAIGNAFSGLNQPNKPRYVFAFFGSSGIGKTATAKALAEFLFMSPEAIIRLDMSEYKDSYTVSRLLGAPPGYIGYEDEGTFATRLRRQPFSIVLLDEIEKAHPEILQTFLHVFDEGRFRDARGRLIEARHAIFIMTSNLVAIQDIPNQEIYDSNVKNVRQSLQNYLTPEFINRINEIVVFRELGVLDLIQIVNQEIRDLNTKLKHSKIELTLSEEAINWIANEASDPNSGARAVSRIFQKMVVEPISKEIIEGTFEGKEKLEIDLLDQKLVFHGLRKS